LYFKGLIDDVRIYSEALSAAQVQALYQGKDVDDTNLEGWWKFDDNTGTSATDSSGNGNTGTISGATWVSDWWRLPQWGDAIEDSNALSFDGTDDFITVADDNSLDFGTTTDFSISAWFRTSAAT